MLKIYYQNVRGLRTKTEDFYSSALIFDYDIIVVTESWLNDMIFDHEILDNRYRVFRRDRSSTRSSLTKKDGGGVVVATLAKYEVVRRSSWESQCEELWISIKCENGLNVNICAVYIPPPINHDYIDTLYNNFTEVINKRSKNNSINLLMGDFNMGTICWEYNLDSGLLVPKGSSNNIENSFLDMLAFNDLHQFNTIVNSSNRILDLVLGSNNSTVSVSEATNPLLLIDPHHPALDITFRMTDNMPLVQSKVKQLNFYLCNYDAVNEELSKIDWFDRWSSITNINEMLFNFYDIVMSIIKKYTPITKPRDERYPVWYSRALLKVIKEKAKYHKLYKKYKNPRDKLAFETLRMRCSVLIKECYSIFKKNIAIHLRRNPKYVWRYFKNKRVGNNYIPNKMTMDNTNIARGGQEICDLFSVHFQSIYRVHGGSCSAGSVKATPCNNTFSSCILEVKEILDCLSSLDCDKGPGPDSIPPLFLRKCAANLAGPLTTIFNYSLSQGIFPDQWKIAHITPIFKSGNVDNVANYKPVSILSACGKVIESLVQRKMFSHFKNVLDDNQHGFRPKKWTLSNLVEYVTYISSALDGGTEVHAIYTDFKKAFDLVDHNLLIAKLEGIGVHGSLLRWCESYLRNRSQLVYLKGFKSNQCFIPSGVPQGSHLGPLFFLVFINDLGNEISSKYKLFADDLKIY